MRIIIPLPPEAFKAVDRKDKSTIDMFGGGLAQGSAPTPTGDASHGGALHAEKRVDATGRTETRWIATTKAPTPKPPPAAAPTPPPPQAAKEEPAPQAATRKAKATPVVNLNPANPVLEVTSAEAAILREMARHARTASDYTWARVKGKGHNRDDLYLPMHVNELAAWLHERRGNPGAPTTFMTREQYYAKEQADKQAALAPAPAAPAHSAHEPDRPARADVPTAAIMGDANAIHARVALMMATARQALKAFDEYATNAPRMNRAELASMLDAAEPQKPEHQSVAVGGLDVETMESVATGEAYNIIKASVDARRQALTGRTPGRPPSRSDITADIAVANRVSGFNPDALVPPTPSPERAKEAAAVIGRQLGDAGALPAEHHDLMRKHGGTAVRFLFHPAIPTRQQAIRAFRGQDEDMAAQVNLKGGRHEIAMYPGVVVDDGHTCQGTTLTHEIGHVIDHLLKPGFNPGQSLEQLADVEGGASDALRASTGPAKHKTIGMKVEDLARARPAWEDLPHEWIAETYRYAYRDGGSMATSLHQRDIDLKRFIEVLDQKVKAALGEGAKSGPIANAPGLHFDNVSHRWKRADPSTPGVHLLNGRAHVVPPQAAHLQRFVGRMHETAANANATLAAHAAGHMEFKRPGTTDHAVVIPDASEKGRWRYSEYGPNGFASHSTFDSPHEAAGAAGAGGFTEPAPGSLDALSGTDEWARGMRNSRVNQVAAGLPFAAAQAVHSHYGESGWSEEAHDRIMQPEHLAALRRGEIPEALKNAAPKLGFGETGPGGERWITVHPHGDDGPGHPILIRQSAHDPTRARVIGGAGGKMTHMDLHLKSPDQWRAKAAERRKVMRDRRANMGADQRKSTDAALKTHREATSAQEAAIHQKIAEAMGWNTAPAEGDDPDDHQAELARRAKQAGDKARHVLIHSKEARTAAGVPVSEVLGTGAIRKTLGYSPDAADVADADMHAERVKVLQHRLATETDPHDQAVHARRLANAKSISADEISDASPAALAGFMRTAHGRIQTAIDSGDLDEETAAKLEIIAKRGKTAGAALRACTEPGGDEAAREALRLAADVGLLDPQAHEEREKAVHEKRFSDAGAPLPDELRATDLAAMTPEAVKVLADEVAARSRATGAKGGSGGGGGGGGGGSKQGGKDETDKKTVDIEELIDQHRAAGEVQEQGGGAPGLSVDDQKDLIARAIKAGIIGKDEGAAPAEGEQPAEGAGGAAPPEGAEGAPAGKPDRQMTMNMSPEQAAEVYRLTHQAKQARKLARKQAQAIARGEDPNVAAETAKEAAGKGGGFLAYDENHAHQLVSALEEDIRVHTARNFLGQVESSAEEVGKNLGMSHEEMQGHLQRHLSVGTTKAITEHAQHILGNAVLDRQAVDVLGSDGAAKLLAWAVHQKRGEDAGAIGDAVGEFHADTQQRVAEGAMAEARDAYHDAHDLHQAMEEEGEHGDMRLLANLNERRVRKLDDAIGKLGTALGEMQTTAALHSALKGKPPTEIRTSMGDMDPDQAVRQARAIGLHPDDYEVEHDGQSTFLKVKESGFGKLVRPVDTEGHRQEQDLEAIKRGDRDEPGWLPPDFARRSAPAAFQGEQAKPNAQPMDYSLKQHGSIEDAMDTFVAQRVHDGWTPAAIMADLQSSDHHQGLEDAHQGGTMDLFGGGGGSEHDAEDLKARYNAHLDKLFPVRHDDTGTRRSAEHADATLKQIADAHPAEDGGLHGQTLDPKHSEDAAFRALARHPEASVAWKDPAALEEHERKALRKAFHRYHGANEGEEMMRRWHDDHPEPPHEPDEAEGQQFGLFGEAPKQQPATADEIKAAREKLDTAKERHKDIAGQVQDHEDALEHLGKEKGKHPPEHPIHQEHAEMKARRDALAEHARTADQAVRVADAEHRNLRDQGKSDAWKSWAKGRDEARDQAGRMTPPSWETYVRAHGGTEAAYRAIQDQVKGRYMEDFRAHYQGLTQQPLRSGVASISGWQQHMHAMDPAFRDWAERSRKQAQGRLQARTAGRYAEDKVRARVEKNLENERAAQQHQTSVGTGATGAARDRLFHDGVPKAHERMALGDAAEAQIAQHVKDFSPMVDPSKPFDAFHGVHMDDRGPKDDKSLQQRAIKAFVRAKKIGLFLKPGSGKTNVALGTFSTLRDQGAARRGLFAAPTAVQGQFGGEALSFLKPGALRWFAKPGASREERMAAYADPGRHMVIVPHQTLRDDITSMVANHLKMPDAEVRERITGRNAEGGASDKGWKPEELDGHIKDAMHAHGADGLLDYMAVDEAHELLNREGKPDAHMTRVIDSLGRLSQHTGWMTGSPVKNDITEVYDWLHKIDPGKYHGGEGGTSVEEFKRRYGGDTGASKAALQRELARYSITGGVDPGTSPQHHEEMLKPEPGQAQRLADIDAAYNKAKLAHANGRTDVDSVRKLAPGLFEGKDEAEHEEIARGVQNPLRLAGLRTAATRRAIHLDPEGAKAKRTVELAKKYKAEGRAGVVFAHDLDAIPILKKHLEDAGLNPIEYHGGMSGPERESARTRFKNGDGDVMIATTAGQTGINMQRASYAIHHDMAQTYIKMDQRQARVNRIGQKFKEPDIHSLLLDHPEEMAARDRVERKEALHHAVTDGAEHLDDSGLSSYIRQHLERKRAG